MGDAPLLASLRDIRRKVKVLAIGYGAGLVIAAAIGLLLAMVLIDWTLGLSVAARLLVLVAAVVAWGMAVYHWLIVPGRSPMGLSDLAGRLEHTFPQFDDRLRSSVDFLRREIPGSSSMKERVVAQTSELAKNVNLEGVIRIRPVWYSTAGGIAAVVLVVLLGIFSNRQYLNIALNRLALGSQPWPKTVQISVDGTIPERVPVGQRVPIKIHLTKGDRESRKAVIYYRYDNGPWQQELMTRSDGAYTASLDARIDQTRNAGMLTVRMEAGDDVKDLAPIHVVPRLDIARVDAEVLPPDYVKPRQSTNVNLSERPAVVAVGSDVAIKLTFNKSLATDKPVELIAPPGQKLPPAMAALKWDRSGESVVVAHLQAAETFRFAVRATDADQFQNTAGEEFELIVREDQPPTVQIEEPRRSEDRTPDAAFDLKAVAEDDYGVAGAQLVVQRLGEKPGGTQKNNWVIDLVRPESVLALNTTWIPTDSTAERKRYRLEHHWELEKLENANLKPGDVLEYFIQVHDNFNLNGRQHDWVPSGKLRVTIISHEQWDKAVTSVIEQTFQSVKQIDQGQMRNKGETQTLKQGVDQKKKFDEADQAQAERLANQQSGTASQTEQVSQKLQQLVQKMLENKSPEGGMKQTAMDVKKQLEQIAEGAMRDAARELSKANAAKPDAKATPQQSAADAQQRSEAMDKSSKSQERASEQLKAAMERLGNFGGLSEAVEKFRDIKEQQDKLQKAFNDAMKPNLGKKPEEMSKQDQDSAKKMAAEQKALGDRTQKALDDLQKKAEQTSKSDPAASEAMKQAAAAGQQQQVPGKQSQASQSMQQNQQGQAQQQHQQIELGLDLIISKLKEAERRKLEELQRKLAELRQQVAELVRKQAGHNIDNLLLQGGQARLEKVESNERKELIEMSARDDKALAAAPPAAGQQSAMQELTEQNTRDIAHAAEALPDGTVNAKLTAAAGLMERAIVHLRNSKLPDAYDPPQLGALRALADAKKAVDEALRKAEEQLKQEQEETIKQAYVELLKKQTKVGEDLVKIDASPKNEAGELPREVGVRLGQLPGEQGKLSDEAQKLGEKLASLGSVVYVWANKDIVHSMNEVKDDLAKPDTGQPTQAEEKRIEEQLKAMIENLAQKKKDPQFANRGGGGGGGGKGKPPPKMPTDIELRLLKSLQQAVNTNTNKLDVDKAKDNQKLLSLGGRQGELRNLLDQLMRKASNDQVKLDAEPDNKEQLPEEAKKEDVDDQEFVKGLLNNDLAGDTVDKGVKLTGDRMARSRQRLALNNDPGKVTQEIQKRIVTDLDHMIELAQQQQQQSQSKPGQGQPKPGDQPGPPQEGKGQGQQMAQGEQGKNQQKGGQSAAQQSTDAAGSASAADLSKTLAERAAEWGGITPRDRQAVQEGATEKPLDKYRKFIEDYYKSVSEGAAKR